MSSMEETMNQRAKIDIAWGLLLAAIALTVTPAANAQLMNGGGAQAHDWEFIIGPSFLLSNNFNANGGSTVNIDSTVGFKIGAYYYLTDHFSLGGTYGYAGAGFNATVQSATSPGTTSLENGHLYINQFMFDARYSLLQGPIRPYALVGMGYNYTNTNIANGYSSGCWWDPWWGYYCGTYAHTKSVSGFTYQVGAGVEVNFSRSFAVDVGYNETWVDWSHGTPGFGSVDLMFVWRTPSYY
jgi:opacity protein-like surface antigen